MVCKLELGLELDRAIEGFFNRACEISVTQCINYLLYIFDDVESKVLYEHKVVTITNMGEIWSHRDKTRAGSIKLWFRGGPKGTVWYHATLLHLLLDRYFMALAKREDGRARQLEQRLIPKVVL
jgi:hypothetical protein